MSKQSIYLWELSDHAKALCKSADERGWTVQDARNLRLLSRFIESSLTKTPLDGNRWYKLHQLMEANRSKLNALYLEGIIVQPERCTLDRVATFDIAKQMLLENVKAAFDEGFDEYHLHAIMYFANLCRYQLSSERNTQEATSE